MAVPVRKGSKQKVESRKLKSSNQLSVISNQSTVCIVWSEMPGSSEIPESPGEFVSQDTGDELLTS